MSALSLVAALGSSRQDLTQLSKSTNVLDTASTMKSSALYVTVDKLFNADYMIELMDDPHDQQYVMDRWLLSQIAYTEALKNLIFEISDDTVQPFIEDFFKIAKSNINTICKHISNARPICENIIHFVPPCATTV